jgi:hypothetical protein
MAIRRFFVLSLLFIFFILVNGCSTTPPVLYGSIELNSTPAGARVYLDGSDTGQATPITLTNITPGNHSIMLDLFHYQIWEDSSVQVLAGETTYLNPLLTYADEVSLDLQPGGEGKDASVETHLPDNNYGTLSYGAVGYLTTNKLRAYFQFDLSSVPMNAVVVEAKLKIYQWLTYGTENFLIGIYPVTDSWDENTITWNLQPASSSTWEATAEVVVGTTTWQSLDIDGLVQSWIDGSITNDGLVLKDTNEVTANSQMLFYTSDYSVNVNFRPKLEMDYYIP